MYERSICEPESQIGDKQPCDVSFSSPFEFRAAIGGNPDIDEVRDLFIKASKVVLNIEDESNRPTIRSYRRTTTRRNSVGETKRRVDTEVKLIDSEKLGIYFSSEDGIRCFSIVVNIVVTSSNGDLLRMSSTAENLALAAELAFVNGEFEQRLKEVEGDISVLLLEMASESSSNGDVEDDYHDSENEDKCNFHDEEADDNSSLSSMDPDDFDEYLDKSYTEYLQDQSDQQIVSKIKPPISPCTVFEYPTECAKKCPIPPSTSPYSIDLQAESKTSIQLKVKFDPVVRVKCTLSRHDMTPREMFKYWSSGQESLTKEERERMLKTLTERWLQQKERESNVQEDEDVNALSSPPLVPLVPGTKQLLPESDREGHDEYNYTMSIRD